METESRRGRRKRRREKAKQKNAPRQKIIVEDFSAFETDFFETGELPAVSAAHDDGFDLIADPPAKKHRKLRLARGTAAIALGTGVCIAAFAWVQAGGDDHKMQTSLIESPAVEAPKSALAKAEPPKPAEVAAPKSAELAPPKVELPAPKVEAPKAAAPTIAAPVAVAPTIVAPKVEPPMTPKRETQVATAPKIEKPIAAAPKIEKPIAAAPKALINEARSAKKEALRAFERGDFATALTAGQNAIALDPADAEAWLVVGAVHQQRGNDAAARKIYKSCASQARRGPREECAALSAASR
jgi:hypothetical protein